MQKQTIQTFQKTILDWYAVNQRDLPWRETRDPYHILISEIMLQQTQVTRVIPKFKTWMDTLPAIADLANAQIAQVLLLWSGLGYNRRALNLKKSAEIIVNEYHGIFPKTEKELLQLPGIGTYTARALLCFAFNEQVAVVDTNVRKVILTQYNIPEKDIVSFAEDLLPQGKAYEWNQALMDYASTILKKEKIPLPKQSTFLGSHRYYRGQIIKLLVKEQSITIQTLGKYIKADYQREDTPWLNKLLEELTTEGFITIKKDIVTFRS